MILFFLQFAQIVIGVNQNQSRVILTDFYNSNSPVYVVTPFYESYTINLFDAKDVLENTSFSNIISSDPDTSAAIPNFIQETSQIINKTFCPVDEWGPLYQPVRFYLSVSTIDLLFYNQNEEKIVQVVQTLHQDLNDLFEEIMCYSIFELKNNSQFGVDCDVSKIPSILIFDLIFNEESLIITNFTFNQLYQYQYIDQVQQNFIEKCQYRKTESVTIFDDVRETKTQYIQYCPSLYNPTQLSDQFLIIYHERKREQDTVIELRSQQFNITDLNQTCQIEKDTKIEQIFSNSLLNGYNEKTWNIGFLLQDTSSICKCNVQQQIDHNYTIQCTNTIIELYQPNQIRTVQNLNDEIVLLAGTNVAVIVIYLERSYESQNYFAISYKSIYEPGYYLVDISITNQYLAVILSDSLFNQQISPFYTKPNLYCTQEIQGDTKNILKIFYLDTEYKQIYYQTNELSQFQSFLSSLNQIDFGNFILIYDFLTFQLKVVTIFSKQTNVSYKLNNNDVSQRINQQIPPTIIQFQISGKYCYFNSTTQSKAVEAKTFTRKMIICFIKLEDNSFQLVAQVHLLDPKIENQTLDSCPISQDVYVYQEIINSIDLFEGIMGPLLNFHYVPNYNMSRFYPFYQNHKAIINKDQKLQKLYQNNSVYNVLCAINKNLFITSNIFGVVEILLTYQEDSNNTNNTNVTDIKIQSKKSIIFNQTCIINAKEYSKIEQQFPIQIEIEQCTEEEYRNLTDFLNQVDYYKQFEFYDIAVQYQNSIVVICQKEKKIIGHRNCQNITEFQKQDNSIDQISISQGPVKNEKITYFFTFLYQINQFELIFCDLEIFLPNQFTPKIVTSPPDCYNKIDTYNKIISFRYAFINQQTLFILFDNSRIVIYTPGPTNSTKEVKRYNFTSQLTNKSIFIEQCVNHSFIGFEITNFLESRFSQQYLIVWCQSTSDGFYAPYILQYIISNINQINYWRRLPHYDTVLSDQNKVLLSGLILYVPIKKRSNYNDYFQYYYIYNLEDYTPRSLVEKIEIEKRKSESIITFPINNMVNSLVSGSSISLTLIITRKKFEIFYLNQKAEFIFHLQQQFIQNFNQNPYVLMIAVYQPSKTLTLFRNYTLGYNFSSTQITFAYDNNEPFTVPIQKLYLKTQGGFYQYLLLVNQSFFNGPIASYQHNTTKNNATIIPSPYLQINKYLGDFMKEITILGEPSQIIDVGDQIYLSLLNQNISQINSYTDLILVLTNRFLLFYQKHSFPQENKSCIFTNYTQNASNSQNGQCSIRLIYQVPLRQSNDYLFCQMQLNGVTQVIIVCQIKFLRKRNIEVYSNNNENIQEFDLITYSYDQNTNKVTLISNITNSRQYCFCYYNDLLPFYVNNTVYQMIKLGYQQVNTYFGIYQIDVVDNIIKFVEINSYPNQENFQPYGYADDFAISIIQNQDYLFLFLIILQPENILVQNISLQQGFAELGSAKSLIFSEEEQFIRQERAIFILTVNHNQPHAVSVNLSTQAFLVGNNKQIYEVIFDVFSLQSKLSYTFYQYSLCHHNFINRPQFELSNQNDTVFYLVTQCLSNQFEYQSIQVEMTFLLNQLNTNNIYTSLFIRNFSRNYSRPVEILEPYLVNPQELHLQKIQLYKSFDNTTNSSKSHLLITNSSYFLLDLILFADNGYYIYYPTDLADQNGDQSFPLTISAFNSYSNCSAQFQITWHLQDREIDSQAWFITILSIILLCVLFIIISLISGFCKKSKEQNDISEISLHNEDNKSDYGVELQKTEYNYQKLGDVFRDMKIHLQKKQTLSQNDDNSD